MTRMQMSNYAGSVIYGALALGMIFTAALTQGNAFAVDMTLWSAASAFIACYVGAEVQDQERNGLAHALRFGSVIMTLVSAGLAFWALTMLTIQTLLRDAHYMLYVLCIGHPASAAPSIANCFSPCPTMRQTSAPQGHPDTYL